MWCYLNLTLTPYPAISESKSDIGKQFVPEFVDYLSIILATSSEFKTLTVLQVIDVMLSQTYILDVTIKH